MFSPYSDAVFAVFGRRFCRKCKIVAVNMRTDYSGIVPQMPMVSLFEGATDAVFSRIADEKVVCEKTKTMILEIRFR
jgi:hypothetical protein